MMLIPCVLFLIDTAQRKEKKRKLIELKKELKPKFNINKETNKKCVKHKSEPYDTIRYKKRMDALTSV